MSPSGGAAESVAFSVVVCTRNRAAALARTLETLRTQEVPANWEVLVVDNGSRDGTAACVAEWAPGFPVPLRLVRERRRGLSRARNRGLAEAAGEVLVFIDDDVDCRRGWLAAYAEVFRDATVAGAGGRILPRLPTGTPPWFRDLLAHEVGGPTARYDFGDAPREIGEAGLPTPFGANMAVRRAVARRVGGFRTDLGWGWRLIPSEELEFFARLGACGGRLRYVPAAVVDHRIDPGRVSWRYYVRWQRGYGRALVLMAPVIGWRARLAAARELGLQVRFQTESARRARREGDRIKELIALRERARLQGRLLQTLGL